MKPVVGGLCSSCLVADRCFLVKLRAPAEPHCRGYRKGEAVYSPGKSPSGLFSVRAGILKVCRASEDGRETIVCLARPGDPLGDVSLFAGGDYTTVARAVEDTSVCFLSKLRVYESLAREGALALELARRMANHCQRMRARFSALVEKPVAARVAELLLELCEIDGVYAGVVLTLPLTLKREELASMIGTTTETFVRELKRLEKRRVIDVQRGGVTLLDVPSLRSLARPRDSDWG